MVELENLILHVVSKYTRKTGHGVSRFRLKAILFLVEYSYAKRYGARLTDAKWLAWLFGPLSKEVLDTVDELELSGKLIAVRHAETGGVFYYTSDEPPRVEHSVEKVVDEAVEKYAAMPLEKLLKELYLISEMRDATTGSIVL